MKARIDDSLDHGQMDAMHPMQIGVQYDALLDLLGGGTPQMFEFGDAGADIGRPREGKGATARTDVGALRRDLDQPTIPIGVDTINRAGHMEGYYFAVPSQLRVDAGIAQHMRPALESIGLSMDHEALVCLLIEQDPASGIVFPCIASPEQVDGLSEVIEIAA